MMTDLKIAPALPPMQMRIVGRVEAVKRFQSKHYTRVITPAPDLYSKPSVIDIRSKDRIGQKADEIAVICVLSGFPGRPFKVTDSATGEITTTTSCQHLVDLVE